jgi:hypothetical protein
MGSVAASVFLGRLRDSPEFPEGGADTVGRSLASALDHAATLPARLGGPLADDAQAAFVAGIRASVWLPMVLTAAVALLIWRRLPEPGPDDEPISALESVELTAEAQLGAPVQVRPEAGPERPVAGCSEVKPCPIRGDVPLPPSTPWACA